MSSLGEWWRQFGRLPALPVVVVFFILALLAPLVLDDSATAAVIVVLVADLVVYCVARPRSGAEVFGSAVAPGASSTLLHEIVGMPRWIGLLLIPISLLLIWDQDRKAGSERTAERANEHSLPGATTR